MHFAPSSSQSITPVDELPSSQAGLAGQTLDPSVKADHAPFAEHLVIRRNPGGAVEP